MAGTKQGGRNAAATNKAKYGADFYAKIGAKGGKLGTTGGYFARRDLAESSGAKGGEISKFGHKFIKEDGGYRYYTLKATGETVKYLIGGKVKD